MEKQPYLIFSLKGELFAIAASSVREMFLLPELTPIEEAPPYVAGVFNLRGRIMPAVDLNIRFGHPFRKYTITDSLIVIQNAESPSNTESGVESSEQQKGEDEVEKLRGYEVKEDRFSSSQIHKTRNAKYDIRDTLHEIRLFGLIVNEVRDVVNISPEDIEQPLFYSDTAHCIQHSALEGFHPHFISGEARIGENIVMILNCQAIADLGFHLEESKSEERDMNDDIRDTLHEIQYFCPEATTEEKKIFHERAVNLMRSAVEDEIAGLLPIAVAGIGNEYFGVDLELILEFSGIPDLAPIPCCPEHILGNMNLRGNVLTVIDIRNFLNLSNAELKTKDSTLRTPHSAFEGKVIVADTGGLSAGIAVDSVCDIIYLNPADIRPLPSAVRATAEQYVRGTAPYNNKVMTIIDLKKILASEELVVNEEA